MIIRFCKLIVVITIFLLFVSYLNKFELSSKESVVTSGVIDQNITSIITDKIELCVSENEVCVDSGNKTIYFYAYTKLDVDSLILVDYDSNQVLATLIDDGEYSISGDDIKGDGVYSCELSIDVCEEKVNYYIAKYSDELNEYISNVAQINIYSELNDQQLEDMDEVNEVLSKWRNSNEFADLSLEKRIETTNELLQNLATNGSETRPYSLIVKESIYYDETTNTFSFSYNCGALGAISLK